MRRSSIILLAALIFQPANANDTLPYGVGYCFVETSNCYLEVNEKDVELGILYSADDRLLIKGAGTEADGTPRAETWFKMMRIDGGFPNNPKVLKVHSTGGNELITIGPAWERGFLEELVRGNH